MRAEGKVVASKPLFVNGNIIKDFWFCFSAGRVIEYGTGHGKEILDYLLEVDEGSRYLGEVAFVEADTPIAKTGTLYCFCATDMEAAFGTACFLEQLGHISLLRFRALHKEIL